MERGGWWTAGIWWTERESVYDFGVDLLITITVGWIPTDLSRVLCLLLFGRFQCANICMMVNVVNILGYLLNISM